MKNQVCFPLYAASRILIQAYREPLEELGLTYPQYLVMLILWEKDGLTVSQIGEKLFLDSGTLTPVLKRLEANNFIKRNRSDKDERKVEIELTYPGKSLQAKATPIPEKIHSLLNQWEEGELSLFKIQVNKLIETLKH
ncbi:MULTISPECIES: MarR family winged helix-turn-helix transcriptional regulator [Rhodonellum]|uniref:MarR family winged helix-turn-helix transcriptional regulator n=1 Tax=Rhodonellum TaxID=336827 RepID=UPI001F471F13|nr:MULTISPECIES: MarR family transcriptional regulator [Rhodonellum]